MKMLTYILSLCILLLSLSCSIASKSSLTDRDPAAVGTEEVSADHLLSALRGDSWPEGFFRAVMDNDVGSVRRFIRNNFIRDGFDITAEEYDREYKALLFAAGHGGSEVLRVLLDTGVDKNGGIIFLQVVMLGHDRMVRTFIDAGVDIMATNDKGWTALHIAARWDRGELVRVLIGAGVKVNVEDKKGRTALDVAREFKQDSVISILEMTELQ